MVLVCLCLCQHECLFCILQSPNHRCFTSRTCMHRHGPLPNALGPTARHFCCKGGVHVELRIRSHDPQRSKTHCLTRTSSTLYTCDTVATNSSSSSPHPRPCPSSASVSLICVLVPHPHLHPSSAPTSLIRVRIPHLHLHPLSMPTSLIRAHTPHPRPHSSPRSPTASPCLPQVVLMSSWLPGVCQTHAFPPSLSAHPHI